MNDPYIRKAFHKEFLEVEHRDSNTLIIDELGLKHGKSRADIAVINGYMHGYEIKSDADTLNRLQKQMEIYNAIFDKISIVLTNRHIKEAMNIIPKWWGIILVMIDDIGKLNFNTIRAAQLNEIVNDYAVAQLLWRNEAQDILSSYGFQGARLREARANLYSYLVEATNSNELRFIVRNYLKRRENWRRQE